MDYSDNGVPCDRLDVKGLDVVRSSYPAAFRKFMGEVLLKFLEVILKLNSPIRFTISKKIW
jgi:hypothetical protein